MEPIGFANMSMKKKNYFLFSFLFCVGRQWGSGLSVIGLIWDFICSDTRRILKICIHFLLAKRSWFHIIRLKHCQSFTSFLFPPEIERIPLLSWSWSPFIGFTIFWRGRSSMIYLELLKPYKGYALLKVCIYRVGTSMHWFFILVKIQLVVHLSKVCDFLNLTFVFGSWLLGLCFDILSFALY